MQRQKQLWKLALMASVLITACNKNDTPSPKPPVTPAEGVYVLNEGTALPGTLTYYDFDKASPTTDFYALQNNNATLGMLPNDFIIYGSKMYFIVNKSSLVVIADAHTAKQDTILHFTSNGLESGVAQEPRYAAAYGNHVFVTSSDGYVSVIDTATFSIIRRIKVGSAPEGIVVAGSSLYVANAGWKDVVWPSTTGYDSTVSVIDAATLTEQRKIKTGVNGLGLAADADGNIYEATLGNYNDITGKIYIIRNDGLKDSINIETSGKIAIYKSKAYVYNFDYNTNTPVISVIDLQTKAVSDFITDGTAIQNPYGINIDQSNGDVYITDAVDFTAPGKVCCFDAAGKKKFSFSVAPGVGPNKVVFIR